MKIVLTWILTIGFMQSAAAQLPPEIMVDREWLRVDRLLSEADYQGALAALDRILALHEEHNMGLRDEFHYKQAEAALKVGQAQDAIDAVSRYLVSAGRTGQFHTEALKLLESAEDALRRIEEKRKLDALKQKRVEAERKRVEAEKKENTGQAQRQIEAAGVPLERDTLRSGGLAPEMLKIARGRFQYAVHRINRGKVTTWVVFDKPFAIGKYEVTRGEFKKFVDGSRYRTEAETDPKYGCDNDFSPRSLRGRRTGIGRIKIEDMSWHEPIGLIAQNKHC